MFATVRHPLALLLLLSSVAASEPREENMNIQLEINGQRLQATLENTPSGRDFYALLPLTLSAHDYADTETIADLPCKLTTLGAPAGVDPQIGDITYYAPWGNLALFHRDFGYSNGLIRLGHIDGAPEAFKIKGSASTLIISPIHSDHR